MSRHLTNTIEEARAELRVSRTKIYELIREGKIESVLIGGSRRITSDALMDFLANLPRARAGDMHVDPKTESRVIGHSPREPLPGTESCVATNRRRDLNRVELGAMERDEARKQNECAR